MIPWSWRRAPWSGASSARRNHGDVRYSAHLCIGPSIGTCTLVERFLKANIFNWLIAGTDAHTKNYSLLIAPEDEVRLAPLYDLSSQLPYPDLIAQRVAMKIGEHCDIARVGREDWQKVAQACALPEGTILGMIIEMAESLPKVISSALAQALSDGLATRVVTPLSHQLTQHVRRCLAAVTAVRSKGRRQSR
jgi:serine/threonine-protein kinase HipA